MDRIELPSGLMVTNPMPLLLRFCAEESEYYDAAPVGYPDRIEPVDVLAMIDLEEEPAARALRMSPDPRGGRVLRSGRLFGYAVELAG